MQLSAGRTSLPLPLPPPRALLWLPGPRCILQASRVPAFEELDPPWASGWAAGQLGSVRLAAGRVQSPGNECGHGLGPVGRPTLACPDQVPGGV